MKRYLLGTTGAEIENSLMESQMMGRDLPLISVIVPVYNGQDYLEKCIESIENQTYRNLEVIIVNDGSTDATGAVCDRLRTGYANISVITMEDEGVSAARNRAIDRAAGELVTCVDADDRLRPDMLQVLYACMDKTDSDVAGCSFFPWSSEAEWERALTAKTSGNSRTYRREDYLREAILKGNSRCWSKLYRRSALEKVHFREGLTIGEDMLFLIEMLSHIKRIAEVDYPGYGYFQNPGGAINRDFTPRYMDQITCWKLAREEVVRINRELDARVSALLIVGIMLTAGKLAFLPAKKRREYREYTAICHKELKEAVKVSGAYAGLSVGYRIKAGLFLCCPGCYVWLYHFHKKS